MLAFQEKLVNKNAESITIVAGDTRYTCNDRSVAQPISDAFAVCTTSSCLRERFNCNGETWRVGQCGGNGEITVGGSGVCECDGQATIRPCIGSSNWGGNGGTTCNAGTQTLGIFATYV